MADAETERTVTARSSSQKVALAACLAEGDRARRQGVAHFNNPRMGSPLFVPPFSAQEEAFQLDLVEAWWDGWEGADRVLSSEQVNDAG